MRKNTMTTIFFLLSMSTYASFPKVQPQRLRDYFFNGLNEQQCKTNKKCNMFFRSLKRDSKSCLVEPSLLENASELIKRKYGVMRNYSIKGSIRYIGVYPGKYGYYFHIDNQDNLNIVSNVYFTNHNEVSKKSLDKVKNRTEAAAEYWTQHNPFDSDNIKFQLKIVNSDKHAHITPKLLNKHTRGPYFKNWSTKWYAASFEHEYGHVLGLDDEYNNIQLSVLKHNSTGHQSQCHRSSIMCESFAKPLSYHYYIILRRLFCS